MSKPYFIKLGELVALTPNSVQSTESVFADSNIEARFKKLATDLRKIAPKADDFLYFSAIMLHAAEAALVNSDGSQKKKANGELIKAHWEKKGDSLKWVCSEASLMPYKNNNGDIFPEEELIKSHRDWIGRPLCTDHRSSSVDAIRGIILDTHYDRTFKRVIALCALDKVSYPELARGITSGYKTSVSMGTGVGRAICFSCGQVARAERDFCTHMRTKSSYGEVNADLAPLELSIVVTPADPAAKIRTIIAAANTINSNLSAQEEELSKLSTTQSLNDEQREKLQALEQDLKQANDKLAELKQAIDQEETSEKETVEPPYGQSSGHYSEPNDEVNQSFGLNFPDRFASQDANNLALLGELKKIKASLEHKLTNLETVLSQLHKEDIMSNKGASMDKSAYFQGGGGVNEPTPKQQKYPVDPLNQDCRINKDKQMLGQPPFPEVGPVDGMHPSPASVDQKDELERKKMLLRAEQEQRALRRAAALQKAKENLMTQKEAYWQGGGGVNEPEPKKVKYDIDPLNEKLREKEDKQMVGQKPFPDVGDVDGLHPSPLSADEKDELERKKMLQRASLKARFVRVANTDGTDNLGDSSWQVFTKNDEGEKLVFAASVNEISGNRPEVLFDVIATKEFGTNLLNKIRSEGLNKAASLYKKSQAVAGPGAMPSGTPDASGATGAPAPAAMESAPDMTAQMEDLGKEDHGGDGDKKETAVALAEKVRDEASDLLEKVRDLSGEQAEMGMVEELPKAAQKQLGPLFNMRKQLNEGLISGMKKKIAELREHHEELKLIASVIDSDTTVNREYINTIVDDAFADAQKALSDVEEIKEAHQKYVNGTNGLMKKANAAKKAGLKVNANDSSSSSSSSSTSTDKEDVNDADSSVSSEEDTMSADDNLADFEDESLVDDLNNHDKMGDEFEEEMEDEDLLEPMDEMSEDEEMGYTKHHPEMRPEKELQFDTNDVMVDLPPGTPVPTGAKTPAGNMPAGKTASIDLSTKEGRALYRAKLAADATGKEDNGEVQDMSKAKFSDMLDKSDALANGQTKLDTKPSDDLGKVETPAETNKAMMEVAKAPPKVRKEAERLNQLISEGTVSPSDLDGLVSEGLDPEVVKYWRQFYGEAGKEGAEFGRMLTTEVMKAKAEEKMQAFKVKVARSYELAYDMVRRGLLNDDRIAVSAQVDEIMKWNDEAFESMKRVIAKHAPTSISKQAMVLPQVGLIGASDVAPAQEVGFQSELDAMFAGRRF